MLHANATGVSDDDEIHVLKKKAGNSGSGCSAPKDTGGTKRDDLAQLATGIPQLRHHWP